MELLERASMHVFSVECITTWKESGCASSMTNFEFCRDRPHSMELPTLVLMYSWCCQSCWNFVHRFYTLKAQNKNWSSEAFPPFDVTWRRRSVRSATHQLSVAIEDVCPENKQRRHVHLPLTSTAVVLPTCQRRKEQRSCSSLYVQTLYVEPASARPRCTCALDRTEILWSERSAWWTPPEWSKPTLIV